jgi:4-diphosphocytidyl-2-C-methyl-D-erythritol kinase
MIAYPNAKINLGLNILRKRPDGFHDIETVFYPIALFDVLEIILAEDGQFSFISAGEEIPGDHQQNLCIKAFELLQSRGYPVAPVRIMLEKRIPVGSGLGGGSSDGAFTLKMLNELFTLGLGLNQLAELAAGLGSDCPFFLHNAPMLASGRGEILSPVAVSLSGSRIAVVIPPVRVSTATAYSKVTPRAPVLAVREVPGKPVTEWKGALVNDFEDTVFSEFPRIGEAKEQLYELGAVYASLSGSGSAVYGIFRKEIDLETQFPGCFTYLTPESV